MDLKNVTKTQLRDFIDSKISKRRMELKDEIRAIVIDRMSKALNDLLGDMSELERVASRFEDLLTEKIHLLGDNSVPVYAATAATQAGKIYKAHKYFLDEIVTKALDALVSSSRYQTRFTCVPLMDTFKELNAELQPKLKLCREGLDTLKNELHNAVTNEATGKRGYNALVALGVDMSDLPEISSNLPAVVKLSVDVCVLNGDCDKKESA